MPVGLTPGRNGVLYGVTNAGGRNRNCNSGCGTLYRLTPPPPGRNVWTETVLYDFRYKGDPLTPVSRLVADENGFYHASSSKGITYSKFEGYWGKRIVGYRRIPLSYMRNFVEPNLAEAGK